MEMVSIYKKVKMYILVGLILTAVVAGAAFCANQQKGEIISISKRELNEMINSKGTFYVYVGRPNCPDCQEFYPEFEKSVHDKGITIYYFNTKVKVSQKSEMSEYVKSMGINEIPAILEVNKGRIVTVYDGQIDNDMKKFYEKCREN
ncbi:thioredoxin domain-containing protein [Hornefia butyriciproducens]|uniref:thioredoxin domain-containing protein n=1 Tax=Hornefia butyriciproducens TaxID=2652293 RepID=UPI003CFFBE82